ncbi:hypothetical protein EV363DRAFT_707185 [Boletus edulis]|nr:hypothetical protein EV363DRAFT_707185 [Boletus edulis]
MSTHQPTEKKQPSFGDKMKGVAHIAHGVGEDFRGSVMGAFESVSGSDESKAKQQDIASKGKVEIERGVAQLKGVSPPTSAATGPEPPAEAKAGEKLKEQPAKEEVSGPTPVPPPSPVESRQPQPETSQQQPPVGQTGSTEKVQQSTQSTQAGSEATSPQTGAQDQPGEGPKITQGPGSSV